MTFTLHPQLEKDTLTVGNLSLCHVLLMNDSRFPWLILVPRRENLRELFELTPDDYKTAMQEIRAVSESFSALTKADKMNVAALGNMVPQLHIHIIARFSTDSAWPKPVWGQGTAITYPDGEVEKLIHRIRTELNITKM